MSFVSRRVLPAAPDPDPAAARALRIGFLCPHNPFDRCAFSGTAYHMRRALTAAEGVALEVLGGHRPPGRFDRFLRRPRHIPIATAGLDWIVALTSTDILDRLIGRTGVPVVHVTDATPAFLREVYGYDIPPEADAAEARVVAGAARTIYSSRHMAERAVADFGPAVAGRVAYIPFGINFDRLPGTPPASPAATPLRLLYVGGDWRRKGGEIALAALDLLRARGLDVRLTCVGAVPRSVRGHPGVTAAGYLDKNRPAEAARLARLFSEAHLLVLPTRADCTPMVVAEANAHGCPVLVTDIGGTGSLMDPGQNGRTLPLSAGAADWAAAIRALTADSGAHAALRRSSFAHAHRRLTWAAWARDTVALLHRPTPLQRCA